jgi:23S rRNA pseudouridine2605 synthase
MTTGDPGADPRGERLQKLLARAGLGSRRTCEELIEQGRALVNGEVAHLGQRADASRDRIVVDGIPLPGRQGLAYYLVNKPAGVVCTASDPEGRPNVVGLVPPGGPRVFPVGRLDLATEGLIVLTNDGELAHQLTHPRFGVEKEYVVEVDRPLSKEAVGRLRRGVDIGDSVTAPARVKVLSATVFKVVVHEGRNRQVRRMCEAVGYRVRSLTRVRLGPLRDASLSPGRARELTPGEVVALWRASTGAAAGPPAKPAGLSVVAGRQHAGGLAGPRRERLS